MSIPSFVRRAWAGACLATVVMAAPGVAFGQAELKYKWNKGEVLHYRSVQESTGKMTVPGMDGKRETSQRQEIVQRFEVKEVGADGVATLDMSFVSVKIEADQGNGQKVSYDSTKPEEKPAPGGTAMAAMARASIEAMGALVGEHVTVVITPSGEVQKVDGMGKVVEKMQAKMGGANPNAAKNLRNALGDEATRGRLETLFRVLPGKAAKEGETWTVGAEQPTPGVGGRMKLDTTWTLAGAGKMTSAIKVEAVAPKEGEEPAMPGMKTTINGGSGTGEAQFDAKAGQLASFMMNLTLPIEISIGGQNVKQDTTTKTTFERIAAPAATTPAAPAATPAKPEEKK